MKTTCDGCRAQEYTGLCWKCDLGYKTKEKEWRGIFMGIAPIEQCPKPRTYNEYILQRKLSG